jgi:hypothetical protein
MGRHLEAFGRHLQVGRTGAGIVNLLFEVVVGIAVFLSLVISKVGFAIG